MTCYFKNADCGQVQSPFLYDLLRNGFRDAGTPALCSGACVAPEMSCF